MQSKEMKEYADMDNRDRGFSLIELLVVIAILGIFIGASFATVGLVQAGNMTSVTKNMASGMQETRQKTMTQNLASGFSFSVAIDAEQNASMTITKNAVKNAAGDVTAPAVNTTTELKKCSLYYSDNGAEEAEINGFVMTFDASTGAIKNLEYTLASGGTVNQQSGNGVIRARHGKKESELTIFFATGKYEVK